MDGVSRVSILSPTLGEYMLISKLRVWMGFEAICVLVVSVWESWQGVSQFISWLENARGKDVPMLFHRTPH